MLLLQVVQDQHVPRDVGRVARLIVDVLGHQDQVLVVHPCPVQESGGLLLDGVDEVCHEAGKDLQEDIWFGNTRLKYT